MSDVPDHDDDDDVDWKAIFSLVRQGKTAEIPIANEREYARWAKQVTKRAERRGIAVEVNRGEAVLRVEPRPAVGGNVGAQTSSGEAEPQRMRQQERREGVRAERADGRSREE